METSSLRTLKIMLRNLKKIVRWRIRLQATGYLFVSSGSLFVGPCDVHLHEFIVTVMIYCMHENSKKRTRFSDSWNYLYHPPPPNPPSVKINDNGQITFLPLSFRFLSLANGRFSSKMSLLRYFEGVANSTTARKACYSLLIVFPWFGQALKLKLSTCCYISSSATIA